MPGPDLSELVRLRRARDLIDRRYAEPLDVPTMAAGAHMSPAHFSRRFRGAYGETPHSYLMTRRIERAMVLLRAGESVTRACHAVGCTSLGSFSSRFVEIVGVTPSAYRLRRHAAVEAMPSCVAMLTTRPQRTAGPTHMAGPSEPAGPGESAGPDESSRNEEALVEQRF